MLLILELYNHSYDITQSRYLKNIELSPNSRRYGDLSLKGHSCRGNTPPERTQIPGSKYYECV